MNNIFKLNLEGSMFWQSKIVNHKKIYEQVEYDCKDMSELNYIFLRQLTDGVYAEIFTNKVIKITKDNRYSFSYPRGVLIDTQKLIPSSYQESLTAVKKIRGNKLEQEYLETINDLLVNSNYCEYAKDKKNAIKLSRTKSVSNNN